MSNLRKIDGLVDSVVDSLEEYNYGYQSGLKTLDDTLLGFHKGEQAIIAGRPSMGKSALMMNAALHISASVPCIIFSMEMPESMLIERGLGIIGKVNIHKAKKGRLNGSEQERLEGARHKLKKLNLWIDSTSLVAPCHIAERLDYLKSEFGVVPECVFVDYLQLMCLNRVVESRQQEISEISRRLKAIAKDYAVAMIVLSQLSRKNESGRQGVRMPRLSDLRESGSLEQDADAVIMLHRPAYYAQQENSDREDDGNAVAIIAKNRNGPTKNVHLVWIAEHASFVNVDLGRF